MLLAYYIQQYFNLVDYNSIKGLKVIDCIVLCTMPNTGALTVITNFYDL